MTEAEWWAATDPGLLINWLFFDARAAARKLRLFSVACCRRIEHLLPDGSFADLIRVADDVADGRVEAAEHAAVSGEWWSRWNRSPERGPYYVEAACLACLMAASVNPRAHRDRDDYESEDTLPDAQWVSTYVSDALGPGHRPDPLAHRYQLRLLHDLFGPLPFRDVVIDPGWRTEAVVGLAAGIYDDRAFHLMPVLADALDDAGCDQPDILAHCRLTDREHVRGCWVIDLLLGRPWRDD